MQVKEGVHRLTQGVVNFYLIEAGGKLLLVDAGAPGDWDLLVRAVAVGPQQRHRAGAAVADGPGRDSGRCAAARPRRAVDRGRGRGAAPGEGGRAVLISLTSWRADEP